MSSVTELLLSHVEPITVKQIIVGLNWTLVHGKHGCGVAQTPARDQPNCRPISNAGQLSDLNLKELSSLVKSKNKNEVAIGIAAINAFYNRLDLEVDDGNGLDVFIEKTSKLASIGRFPGLTKRYPSIKIIERNPKKGEFGEQDAKSILLASDQCFITASTLVNGSAENLIRYARHARIVMVGPGTPLCRELFSIGIDILSGLIIHDPKRASQIILEGGAVRELKSSAKFATIRKY